MDNADFTGWIRAAEPCLYKVSVCSGALLGADARARIAKQMGYPHGPATGGA